MKILPCHLLLDMVRRDKAARDQYGMKYADLDNSQKMVVCFQLSGTFYGPEFVGMTDE